MIFMNRFEMTNIFGSAASDFHLLAKDKITNLVLDFGYDTLKVLPFLTRIIAHNHAKWQNGSFLSKRYSCTT